MRQATFTVQLCVGGGRAATVNVYRSVFAGRGFDPAALKGSIRDSSTGIRLQELGPKGPSYSGFPSSRHRDNPVMVNAPDVHVVVEHAVMHSQEPNDELNVEAGGNVPERRGPWR